MTDGIVLKFSAAEATEQQKKFDAATEKTFVTIKSQGAAIAELEAQLSKAQQRIGAVAVAQNASNAANLKVANGIGIYGAALGDVAKKTPELVSANEKARIAIAATGTSSNATSGFLQKLLAATGNQGAARGVGLLASGVRALVTSMNPVGIATGLAAAAVLTFAGNALAAETAAEKLSRRAREVQANFDVLAKSGERVSEKLSSIGDARSATFGTNGIDDAIAKLSAFQGKVIGARNAVSNSLIGNANASLDVEQIKSLGEAIGLTTSDFLKLDRAASLSGDAQKAAIRSFEEAAKVTLTAVNETTLGFETGSKTITLSADEAVRALENQISKTDTQITNLRKQAFESPKNFETLREGLQTEIDLIGKVGKVRETDIKIRELTENGTRKLTARQREQLEVAQSLARYLDDLAASEKRLVEQQREANELADASQEADREREQFVSDRIDADLRYSEVLRRINEDTEILLGTTKDEIRAKQELAAANDALVASDAFRGSPQEDEIRKAVKLREEARLYEEKLQNVKQLGADTFGTIGQNIANAAANGASFRDFLQGTIKDLERIALQRIVVDQLANLGSSFFGAAFGPSRPTRNYANGGVMGGSGPTYYAASGMVLNRTTTLAGGGYNVTAAEGGASAPEAVVPLGRDKYGRLGVVSADGGGGGNITVIVPNVKSAADARAVRPTLRQTLDSVNRANGRWRNGARGR